MIPIVITYVLDTAHLGRVRILSACPGFAFASILYPDAEPPLAGPPILLNDPGDPTLPTMAAVISWRQ